MDKNDNHKEKLKFSSIIDKYTIKIVENHSSKTQYFMQELAKELYESIKDSPIMQQCSTVERLNSFDSDRENLHEIIEKIYMFADKNMVWLGE